MGSLPNFPRRVLGETFKKFRIANGWTMNHAARTLGISRDRLQNIEGGGTRLSIVDVVGLCKIYGASHAEEQELIALAEASSKYGWVEQYGKGIPQYAQKFVSMEQRASHMHVYASELVTGLFQTPDYLRAIHERDHLLNSKWSEQILSARMARTQAMEARANPPQIDVIFGEAVLRRMVGGPEIMRAQIEHLREVAQRPYVSIRVVPFEAGAHPSMPGSNIVLDFPDDEPSVVYIESRDGCRYETDPDTVALYRQDFNETSQFSVPLEEFSNGTVA